MELLTVYMETTITERLSVYLENIETCCGVPCNFFIRISKTNNLINYLVITIEAKNVVDEDGSIYEYLKMAYEADNPVELEQMIARVIKDVDELTYDEKKCILLKAKPANAVANFWEHELTRSKTITFKPVEPCCVCICDTYAKTDCGHFLCVPCADTMESIDGMPPKCPLCRTGNVHVRG